MIAQCLIAAQGTIPDDFTVHSMHCYFVLAGNPDVPILYHVEHVREGRSFATRTVQARQRGQPIFTTTLSFVRENSAGSETLKHATKMPDVTAPVEREEDEQLAERINSPMLSQVIGIYNEGSPSVEEKKVRHWVKARGRVSEEGGHGAHLAALAYISDSLFIGTVARIHKAWRPMVDSRRKDGYQPAEMRKRDDSEAKNGPELGMMVSLDHTIYFHNSRAFRADEWMMTEMESPWAGDGRGLVFQRIYTRDGVLVASCVQEVSYPYIRCLITE